jgi:PAS domain S-box-containing protein
MEDSGVNIKSFLKFIFRSFSNPVLALNSANQILEISDSASTIFKIDKSDINLSDVLLPESYNKLDELIKNITEKKSYVVLEDFKLQLRDSTSIVSNIVLNCIDCEDDMLILLTLVEENAAESFFNFTKIDIRSGNPLEAISNPKLKQVVREIRNLYPLTVTGKDRLSKIIDEFDELIRLKNDQGKFVLVNLAYAQSLGIAVSQLEGRSEKDFIPSFLMDLLNSIDKYLYETHNYIIIEGMPLKGISKVTEQHVIEIPITDYQNNVKAVLGITQNIQRISEKDISAEVRISGELVEIFPKPLAFIDQYSQLQHASSEFCKLVSQESGLLTGMHVSEILPSELSEEIKSFQNSTSSTKIFYLNDSLLLSIENESKYKVYLTKISISTLNSEGVLLYIDETPENIDINKLIVQKGNMLDILIQNNPEPIYIYDIDNLRFLEANEAALQLYGYSRDEFLQMDLTDLYTPEDIQTLLGSSIDHSPMGVFAGPYRHKKRNGSSVFVEISKIKFQFNGKDSYFNIVRDVSVKLELERNNQLFKAAFDNTKDTIFTTDAGGFINYLNTSGKELLGYSQQEIINSSFTSLVKDDDRSMINTSVFISEIKEPVKLLLEIKKKDGSFQSSEVIFTPVLDFQSHIDSFTILLIPVKEEAEEQIKEVVKEVIIETEIKSDKMKTDPDFLSGVFHEILTPMNVILGFAQELTESIENPTPEQKEASNLINQNKLKLLGTMNSVVEYSELLQNKSQINFTEISITQIIEKIDKKIPEIVNSPEVELSYGKISSSLTFKTDPQKFETLVCSLIKVISRVVKEKKFYFSSFPFDDENFIVLISDNYNGCSDYLTSRLQLIYKGNNNIKDLGTPKLTTHLSRILLPILGGSLLNDEKFGAGFLFPIIPSQISGTRKFESIDESIEELVNKIEPDTFDPFGAPTEIVREETVAESDFKTEAVPESELNQFEESDESEPIIEDLLQSEGESAIENEIILESPDTEISLSEELSAETQTDTNETQKKPPSKLDISKLSCLYIEDQVDSQILFKVQMKGLNEIKFAVSFEEALPLLESRTFDFIVMDINLQGEYNGLDALKIINKMPSHEKTPVIAVTAYVLPGDKEKFIATGFNDFVSKPIFREKMIESLERVFSK